MYVVNFYGNSAGLSGAFKCMIGCCSFCGLTCAATSMVATYAALTVGTSAATML